MKILLYISFVLSILTYSLWEWLPEGYFYIGNALFIFSLSLYLYADDKQSFIKYIILCCSVSNLLDELIFNPLQLVLNEYLFALLSALYWVYKRRKNGGKNNRE